MILVIHKPNSLSKQLLRLRACLLRGHITFTCDSFSSQEWGAYNIVLLHNSSFLYSSNILTPTFCMTTLHSTVGQPLRVVCNNTPPPPTNTTTLIHPKLIKSIFHTTKHQNHLLSIAAIVNLNNHHHIHHINTQH